MMLVSVSILIDESEYVDRGPSDERFTANVVSDLLDGLERDTDGLKVIGSQRVDEDYVAAWRGATTYIGGDLYPGAARAILPYTDARDPDEIARRERTGNFAVTTGMSACNDQRCGMCRNALTVGEARDNGRYCDTCERARRPIAQRLQYLEDGTGSIVDNETASIIELSGIYDTGRGGLEATIKRIHVNSPARGKGVASVLLDAACDDADSGGVTLHLEVAARDGAGGLDNDQLAAWYRRHGFVLDDNNPRNFVSAGRTTWMVRRPTGERA